MNRASLTASLLIVLIVAIVVGIFALWNTSKVHPLRLVYYDNLTRIDRSTAEIPNRFLPSSEGVYVIFFRNQTLQVPTNNVSVVFDSSLDKPKVKGVFCNMHGSLSQEHLRRVIIAFRDKEQMKEYWP